jgi:hypothetical protein
MVAECRSDVARDAAPHTSKVRGAVYLQHRIFPGTAILAVFLIGILRDVPKVTCERACISEIYAMAACQAVQFLLLLS